LVSGFDSEGKFET